MKLTYREGHSFLVAGGALTGAALAAGLISGATRTARPLALVAVLCGILALLYFLIAIGALLSKRKILGPENAARTSKRTSAWLVVISVVFLGLMGPVLIPIGLVGCVAAALILGVSMTAHANYVSKHTALGTDETQL